MEKVSIKIKTVNDAFYPKPEIEVARILREIADRIEIRIHPNYASDSSGNTVGKIKIR